MSELLFSIARDFSPNPGPRFIRQGAHSGEALRRRLLHFLDANEGVVVVDLDGTKGFGSSFLDEAFGGLVRSENKNKDELLKRLRFRSIVDPSYVDEILDSIERAVPGAETVH